MSKPRTATPQSVSGVYTRMVSPSSTVQSTTGRECSSGWQDPSCGAQAPGGVSGIQPNTLLHRMSCDVERERTHFKRSLLSLVASLIRMMLSYVGHNPVYEILFKKINVCLRKQRFALPTSFVQGC